MLFDSPKRAPERGFTLVEVLTVVAIVGVLSTVAFLQLRPSEYARSARGFADRLSAFADKARSRALSSQRIQRLQIEGDAVFHLQAQSTGLGTPSGWDQIATVYPPTDISVVSTDGKTHLEAGVSVPAAGSNLPATIDFSPDGSAAAFTIFIGDAADKNRARVTFFGATGTGRVFSEW